MTTNPILWNPQNNTSIEHLIGESWYNALKEEFSKEYMKALSRRIIQERETNTILPANYEVFKAYQLTLVDKVKVVFIGQEPDPNGQPDGLAFGCSKYNVTETLSNIFKEIQHDFCKLRSPIFNKDLTYWATQGVFLLNYSLTSRKHEVKAHDYIGWKPFIHKTLEVLNNNHNKIIFVLFGMRTRSAASYIDTTKHKLIVTSFPNHKGLRMHFKNGNIFNEINETLIESGQEPIKWHYEQ